MSLRLKIILVLVATVVITSVVAGITALARARQRGNIHSCWEYLRLIDSAKENVVLTRGLTNGQSVAWSDLDALVTRGAPRQCLLDGALTPGAVGILPSCSMHGELTQDPTEFERRNGLTVTVSADLEK